MRHTTLVFACILVMCGSIAAQKSPEITEHKMDEKAVYSTLMRTMASGAGENHPVILFSEREAQEIDTLSEDLSIMSIVFPRTSPGGFTSQTEPSGRRALAQTSPDP